MLSSHRSAAVARLWPEDPSSSLLGPVILSLRALSGRLKFTVRRHKFNTHSLSVASNRQSRLTASAAKVSFMSALHLTFRVHVHLPIVDTSSIESRAVSDRRVLDGDA